MQDLRTWRPPVSRYAQQRAIAARRLLAAGCAMVVLAACASSTMAPQDAGMTRDTSLGAVLVDSKGMTLYTYDKDEPDQSHCSGLCAAVWPPVTASEAATKTDGFAVITREDGSGQWAYRGDPLYTYVRDAKPGDVRGDGVGGVWHAAKL